MCRAHQKLSFKFFGPYKIVAKIGPVAYKLALPDTPSIHPGFHVSQLKKQVPPDHQVTASVPNLSDGLQVPEHVLQRHLSATGTVDEVLVQWSGTPASLATWENAADLHRQFPRAPAWGQAGSVGGGMSARL